MKRQKRITKRERKANDPTHRPGVRASTGQQAHIHCVACGRHVEPSEFDERPPSATWITCDHGSTFPACIGCMNEAQARVDEHDRTGQPVQTAGAWH
jgi:hypothetical protein